MKSMILFFFLLQTILNVVNIAKAEPINTDIFRCKKESGTFQPNSPYKTNLLAALKKLPGSNYATVGDKPDTKVIVLALCAGYLKPNDCASCVNSTIPLLLQKCPNQKVAVAWRVKCMVRYGMHVVNNYDVWFVANEVSPVKVKDVALLEKNRPSLERMLFLEVERKTQQPYAYNALAYGSDQTLHMVMQCTPDISPSLCKECLAKVSGEIKSCCSGATAAAVLSPNCYMRYAHADFRNP